MKLCNTAEHKEYINAVMEYCEYQLSLRDFYYGLCYEDMVDNMESEPIQFIVNDNDEVTAIAISYQQFGQTIWHADNLSNEIVATLQNVTNGALFICLDGSGQKFDLYPTICCTSYNEQVIYPAIVNARVWTTDSDAVTVLRDWLEDKHLTPSANWQSNIEYTWVKKFPDMFYDKEMLDYPWNRNDFGHYSYIGFHYLNWDHSDENTWYLFATVNKKPIGCICIERYKEYGYYGLSYIDVAFPYKKNGLAKSLIRELARVIPDDMPLLLSMESDEGRKCHIHECFKRVNWPNGIFTQEEFDAMRRKKV